MISFENIDEQTLRRIGFCLGRTLCAGDVVLLRGEMGAGKSVLTRAAAQGMGVTGPVPSPTFTILQVHEDGRMPLYHFDWYRLSGADELYELSMDEYLHAGGVAVIEWPSRAEEAIPETYLEVALEPLSDDVRRITLTPVGGFHELDLKGLTL